MIPGLQEIAGNPEMVVSNVNRFGGFSCQKRSMAYKGKEYILKFPDNQDDLAEMFPDKMMSHYSMDPACEWLGARIFEHVGIDVQTVGLCTFNGKVVAACENFVRPGEMLLDFNSILDSWSAKNGAVRVGDGSGKDAIEIADLSRVASTAFPGVDLMDKFWDMFVIDALIGNNDRNMNNWGVLINVSDLSFSRFAPVFDNGSSFSKGWSDAFIAEAVKDTRGFRELVCGMEIPFFQDGKPITHRSYLNGNPDEKCKAAMERIIPEIDIGFCREMVGRLEKSGILTRTKADFYMDSLELRYSEILVPALEKVEQEKQGGPK